MADPIDPLLPQPPGVLHVPAGLTDDQKHKWLIGAAIDHVNLHAMAWPARDKNGTLRPPPDEHVLDYLARANDLVDEERTLSTIAASTATVVRTLPTCDLCKKHPARYDATITLHGQEGGAFMCPGCYDKQGTGTLGATGDVYMMTPDEISDWVRSQYNAVAEAEGKQPLATP